MFTLSNPQKIRLGISFAVCAAVWGLCHTNSVSAGHKKAEYKVLETLTKSIEIREYAPQLVADVIVPGARIEAAEEGFPQLFDYIDGANRPSIAMASTKINKDKESTKSGETIHMTVPVVEVPSNDGWKTRFFLPDSYTLQTIPRPINSNIVISQTQPRKVAVLRFTGSDKDEILNQHEVQLRNELEKSGKTVTGPAEYAFYNPPLKPPFLRKNEVMLPVE